MTISHVIGIFSPEHGGPVVSLANYASGQAKAGLKVQIRTVEGYPNTGPAVRLPSPIDERVFPLGKPFKLGRSRAMSEFMRAESGPDIYHLHGAWLRAMYYGYREAIGRNKPYLVQVNGSYQPFDLKRKPWRKNIVRMWYQDRIFHRAKCLHVNSTKEAAEIRAMGFTAPIVVIPAGFDFVEMDHRLNSLPDNLWPELRTRPFFLYLARIHPSKGIGLLLQAWSELTQEFPDMTMVVVGGGERDHVAQFRAQAKDLGIEDRCLWKGFVTEDEKVWAYANARFYCLPSFTENFGNTVQEALGLGTPVVATNATPWTNLGKIGCGWVADCTVDSVRSELKLALSTPSSILREMGRIGRKYIMDGFSLESVINEQIRTYRWLLGEAPPPSCMYTDSNPAIKAESSR
jgi:glycosyltransferase involved in cell wall biosynthesis